MAAPKSRRGLLPRRRRHDDEEDGSTAGDAPAYASSEGSVTSEEDGDVSGNSADEETTPSPVLNKQALPADATRSAETFKTTADTEAMVNGLKIQDGETVEELDFDAAVEVDASQLQPPPQPEQRSKSQPIQPKNQRIGSLQSTQPRKGYSMHDDRSKEQQYALPATSRGRGRGYGAPSHRGNYGSYTHDTGKQWTHDLHETVNQPVASAPQPSQPMNQPSTATPAGPNRSFSTTTVLGKVPVNVSIPGIEKKSSANMVKKHYTLLPQHRPPLRRDKPVRISIPNEHPRYIFPSTERSFIFIPRAMRPNQQQFRGRGRGSFGGSRRTSMYGGSAYTPSIGMSRRPSIAASATGSGIHTPTGMPLPQYPMGMQKPVVRMPAHPNYAFFPGMQSADVFMGDNSAIIHSPLTTLPMHQPTPQKTVSIDNIESPSMNVPQQQSQQPFHQQIPAHMQEQGQQKMPHIPEGAVYAQPFQPYPTMPQQAYYGMPYHMMQPAENMGYGMGMGGPVMAPAQQPAASGPEGQQQGSSAYETNGMVYYYDPAQQYAYPPMGNMMQPGPYFYPNAQQQMFYQ
ncbi:hypothetical protein PMZ80_005469 [Knufia obscura]|uniref:Btz domain-containing protein n=1 Tax=Knufia obscura TaxID=1635080 RepID=A0ABR0RRN7_9EURO|nr:hypothetical protein PMZ80_005469 [Knufia obscura]